MSFKEAYQFLFYKLYKTIKNISIPEFMSDWKAVALMIMLEILLFFSAALYYMIFIDRRTKFLDYNLTYILPLVGIISIKYFLFADTQKCLMIINKFDSLSKKENIMGG